MSKNTFGGDRLRKERERLGLTQEQIADLVGIERARWSRYENGVTIPRSDTLEAFKKAGVDVGYVLTGERGSLSTTVLTIDEEDLLGNYRKATEENRKVARKIIYALARLNKNEESIISEPSHHSYDVRNDVSNSTHLSVQEEPQIYEADVPKKRGKKDK